MKKKSFSSERSRRAFTLIELLVVTTIIVLLTVVVAINLDKARTKSRDAQRKADLTKIAAALEMYKAEHKVYIDNSSGFVDANATNLALLIDDDSSPMAVGSNFIPTIPTDPMYATDASYKYEYKGTTEAFKLRAKSETIVGSCTSSVVVDAKSKAGDFYNSSTATSTECTYLQVSSSATSLAW